MYKFLNRNENINKEAKELDKLIYEYEQKQYKEFDTWDKTDEELIEIYKKCLKEEKSYDELYGENKYSKFKDD